MPDAKTVLVADDNAPFRMLLSAFLRKNGYTPIEAHDGEQALSIVQNQQIDLLLIDLQMQPLGGFDFIEKYKNLDYKMPVVLITADPSSDILTRSAKLGFDAVLKKPVTEQRILAIVQKFLG